MGLGEVALSVGLWAWEGRCDTIDATTCGMSTGGACSSRVITAVQHGASIGRIIGMEPLNDVS